MCWLPSAALHQQNHPFLNWKCRLTQADLCYGRKTVVVVVVVVVVVFIADLFKGRKTVIVFTGPHQRRAINTLAVAESVQRRSGLSVCLSVSRVINVLLSKKK